MIDYLHPTHPSNFNRNTTLFASSNIPLSCSTQQFIHDKNKNNSTKNKSKRHSIASFDHLHLYLTTITTTTNTTLKSKSACMCALYSSPAPSSPSLASAPTTFKHRTASNNSISAPSSPSSHSSRARTMKGKAPGLVLAAQQQQDSQQQQQQQQQQHQLYLYNDDNFSYPQNTRMTTYHARPHFQPQQQNQARHQKRNSYHGNAGQKHQYLQRQFYQQQYHDYYYNQYSHHDQDMYYSNSNNGTPYSNGHGYNKFSCNGNSNSDHHQRSFMSCASAKDEVPASLVASSAASTPMIAASKSTSVTHTPIPELVVSNDTPLYSYKAHSSISSPSISSSQVPVVSEGKAKETQSSPPEPSKMQSTQLTQNSQEQSSDRAGKKGDAALQR
ncbi:hypothetical protein BGZ93_002206 [Podila epicladia]|nr:hypothetical protein BGZ93_002206 [Podila epicladia]